MNRHSSHWMKGLEYLEGPARYFEFWHSVTAKGLQPGDRESRDTVYMNSTNVMCQGSRISGPEVANIA